MLQVQSRLGHSSPQITQRYAHLADNGLRRASQSVASAISAALGKEAAAAV
jgi:integrase